MKLTKAHVQKNAEQLQFQQETKRTVEKLILSDDVEKRVMEFKRVIEAVVRSRFGGNDLYNRRKGYRFNVDGYFGQYRSGFIASILSSVSRKVSAKTYRYVAKMFKRGEAVNARGRLRQNDLSHQIRQSGKNNVTYVRYVMGEIEFGQIESIHFQSRVSQSTQELLRHNWGKHYYGLDPHKHMSTRYRTRGE